MTSLPTPQSLLRQPASRRSILQAIGAALATPAGSFELLPSPAAATEWQASVKGPYVMSVRGPLPAAELGFTLPHEHVLITHSKNPVNNLTDPELAVRELKLYAAAGGNSLCEMTNVGIQRDPVALRAIAERTGVNIIMGAGFYKDEFLPPGTHERSVEDLTSEIVRDIQIGVGNTGIRAGIIGEVGLSSARQTHARTATEERALRAAARAQRITGVGLSLHFDIPADPEEHLTALEILAKEGADLSRVAVGHQLPNPARVEHYRRLAKLGCFIQFDLFGLEGIIKRTLLPEEAVKLATIRDLIAEGLGPNLLMSQDVCFQGCLVEKGGKGYAHLLNNILPKLERLGVAPEALRAITVENPRRLLTIQPPT